jgi:hypothetical protein
MNTLPIIALDDWTPIIASVGGLLSIIMLFVAMRANKRGRLISDVPTSKTSGVFIGLVELKGTAESESPLTSFLDECHCVWFQYSIAEHWSRTVTETYTDSDGNTKTRTRRESGWKTVDSGGSMQPFYLKDDVGAVRVLPEGAETSGDGVFSETVSRGDPLYYGKGPAMAVAHSDHRRRFVESAIRLHAPLYLMGPSRLREDIVAPEIAHDKYAQLFMISTKSEESIVKGYTWQFAGFGILGAVLAGAGTGIAVASTGTTTQEQAILYGILGAVVYGFFFAIGWVWTVYNSLIGLRNRVNQAWSNVDVELKRRSDLIPNIVKSIESATGHEREVQEELAALRAQAGVTQPGDSGPDPEGVAGRLIAVVEQYPELKTNDNFLHLQEQLIDTEQRIALAREYYNESVEYYNNRREVVPDRFIASLAGMPPKPYIQAENFERAAVKVDFAK